MPGAACAPGSCAAVAGLVAATTEGPSEEPSLVDGIRLRHPNGVDHEHRKNPVFLLRLLDENSAAPDAEVLAGGLGELQPDAPPEQLAVHPQLLVGRFDSLLDGQLLHLDVTDGEILHLTGELLDGPPALALQLPALPLHENGELLEIRRQLTDERLPFALLLVPVAVDGGQDEVFVHGADFVQQVVEPTDEFHRILLEHVNTAPCRVFPFETIS